MSKQYFQWVSGLPALYRQQHWTEMSVWWLTLQKKEGTKIEDLGRVIAISYSPHIITTCRLLFG